MALMCDTSVLQPAAAKALDLYEQHLITFHQLKHIFMSVYPPQINVDTATQMYQKMEGWHQIVHNLLNCIGT